MAACSGKAIGCWDTGMGHLGSDREFELEDPFPSLYE
jgi:hypothetical protein